MATSGLNLAQVDEWGKAKKERLLAIFRESTQRVASIAANGVPIKTGFARASVRASKSEMPPIDKGFSGKKGETYNATASFDEVTTVIASAQLGETVYVGWTAAYARRLEYGFTGKDSLGRYFNQPPRSFVRLAALQWPKIVAEVTQEAKARAAI